MYTPRDLIIEKSIAIGRSAANETGNTVAMYGGRIRSLLREIDEKILLALMSIVEVEVVDDHQNRNQKPEFVRHESNDTTATFS